MVVTNIAKQIIAYNIGNSGLPVPTHFIIGSGSGVVAITDTTLFNSVDRQAVTSTATGTTFKITWQGDWNSVEMSGIVLTEFGVIPSGTALTGSIWSHTSFPSITFDGTNELRIEETWQVY